MNGYIYAALAAAFYGTNPIFAVPLYGCGMSPVSVLFFRYLLGVPLLAAIIIMRSERLMPRREQILPAAGLGAIMGISSLALYESYKYMNPGVASTLLFMYPLLTSLLMTIFFHEKFRAITGICLFIMCCGLYLLMGPADIADANSGVDLPGFILIFISSFSYAIYLVWVKVSPVLRSIPTLQSLLYQLLAGLLVFIAAIAAGASFQMPQGFFGWGNCAALALFPTVLSLLFTIGAIERIGPTPTAIFGALEPITAVALSIIILGDTLSWHEFWGGILIICATMTVAVAGKKGKA